MSAIILKYWNKIYNLQQSTKLTASFEDAYNWLIEGILYALEHKRWLDKDSNIYNDPNGPDKAINRKIKCIRLNHLVSENRDKRKIQINLLSLDSFENPDDFVGEEEYSDTFVSGLVNSFINCGAYLQAVVVDLISNGDGFIRVENELIFDIEELSNVILDLDDNYFNYFSIRYNLTPSKLDDILNNVLYDHSFHDLWGMGEFKVKKTIFQIKSEVDGCMEKLKENKEIRSLLC